MTDEREPIVKAFLRAQSNVDLDTLRSVITDDFVLHGRNGYVGDAAEFVKGVGSPYDHLDDVFTLVSAEPEGNDLVGRVHRELRWREGGELTAWKHLTFRYTVRDGRIAKAVLVESSPWERA